MFREELYTNIEELRKDFEILKIRIEYFFQEQADIVERLVKVDSSLVVSNEAHDNNYGFFVMNDIRQEISYIDSELWFLDGNKDTRLRSELMEHIEGIESKIKQVSSRFKQLNLEIKEAYFAEAIKQKSK